MKKKQAGKKAGISKTSAVENCESYENLTIHPELKSYFSYCLKKASVRLRGMMDKVLEPYNLIAPQLGMMRLIDVHGEVSQSELAQSMGIDKATMVKFIDEMEKSKFVVRIGCETDRRIKYIALTPAGKKMLLKGNELRLAVEKEFLSPLTAQERALLEKALPKLLR